MVSLHQHLQRRAFRTLAVLHLPLALPEASASAMLNAIELLLNHVERWEIRLLETAPAASGLRMAEWAQRI